MIFIDDRAGSAPLIRHPPLTELATLSRFDAGDVFFSGRGPAGRLAVGVEVKSVEDFLSSSLNGRLQATQAPALVSSYDVRWLLVYGGVRRGADGELLIHKTSRSAPAAARRPKLKIRIGRDPESASRNSGPRSHWVPYTWGGGGRPLPFKYLEHRCWELECSGISCWRAHDAKDAAAWIGDLYLWWQTPVAQRDGMRKFDRSRTLPLNLTSLLDSRTKQRAKVLADIPSLGYQRAVAAALHFESLAHAFNAEPSDWAQIDGVGKVIAHSVVDFIRKRRHAQSP